MKYLVSYEEFGSDGDYSPCWEDKEWECLTYESLITEYTRIYLNTIHYPDSWRGVQCYKLEPVELLPDTPEVVAEIERIRQLRIDSEKREKERIRKEDERRKAKQEEYDRAEYERLKQKYEGKQ
jgi:hypothetical protein